MPLRLIQAFPVRGHDLPDGFYHALLRFLVRQRHIQHAAHIRILRYAIARSDLHTGYFCVVRVEAGEVQFIAQSAAVKLGKQYTLADRLSGRTDHGACL